LYYVGDTDGAAICYDQALALDASSPRARRYKASNLLFSGRTAEARDVFLANLRISPRDATAATTRMQIALSHYFERDYEAAADGAKRTIAAYPQHPHAYRLLVAALGQLGRTKEAEAALAKANEISPHPIRDYARKRLPWMRQEDYDHVLDGLRKAGWEG
jgi:adenylate cyclase